MGFFPKLPIQIPFSPGLPHWWDPEFWLFQILAMTILLTVFRKVASRLDREKNEELKQFPSVKDKHLKEK